MARLITIDQFASSIHDILEKYGDEINENMEEAVKMAYDVTNPSQSCLLSPAAASYGFYKDFQERGEDYCRLVNMLQ